MAIGISESILLLLVKAKMSILNFVTRTLSCQRLSPKNLTLRRISILGKIRGKSVLLDKTNHKVIYEFKYVVFVAGFLKIKYVVPIISTPLIAACFYLNEMQLGSLIIIANVFQFTLITGLSKVTKNMIGKIYVNEKNTTDNVILSYIDSNGSRIDQSFSPDQLDLTVTKYARYFGFLTVKAAHENYKLNIRNAYIYDIKALRNLFQEILSYMRVETIKKLKKKSR